MLRPVTGRRPWIATAAIVLLATIDAGLAQQGPDLIGEITAIQKAVFAVRAESPTPLPVTIRQPLLAGDTLRTGERARAQALFRDDTMLTVGPQTQLKIVEYIHDPGQHVRRMTVELAHGSMRALVGRVFPGLGSTFVVHTGTASIIVGTAYCAVWSNELETGAVNIGTSGAVSFAAAGRVVMIEPGFYAIAQAGKPPGAVEAMSAKAPAAAREAISGTVIGEEPDMTVKELAEQVIEEELPSCPPGSPPGGLCPRKPPPSGLPPATPPAVTSGAVRK